MQDAWWIQNTCALELFAPLSASLMGSESQRSFSPSLLKVWCMDQQNQHYRACQEHTPDIQNQNRHLTQSQGIWMPFNFEKHWCSPGVVNPPNLQNHLESLKTYQDLSQNLWQQAFWVLFKASWESPTHRTQPPLPCFIFPLFYTAVETSEVTNQL